jgi:hypothetical protein
MILFKYQGAVLVNGHPGDVVQWEGIAWTVTPQGHLEAIVPDEDPTANQLLDNDTVGENL